LIETERFEDVTCIRMSREVEGRPLYWVAAYLVDGLLIDTGCSYTALELVDFLMDEELRLVVNTHYHEDHVGADRLIQEKFGVSILAHPDSIPLINKVPELKPYQEFVWGYPDTPGQISPLAECVETEKYRFDVLETGGHSAGHVCLVEAGQGWCFSGDIFITDQPKVIRADEDAGGLIESMKLLAGLPTQRLVLFTSMGSIISDGRGALLACAGYLEGLMDQVRVFASQGLTQTEIRERIFGEGSSLAGLTSGHFSSDNLIASILKQ
jgi:glyoxylase-like metal-dependent hydrolase (beta-lactamase superfamily II)